MADALKPYFVAVTVHYWGRAHTAADAEKQLKLAGGTKNARKYGLKVFKCPEGTTGAAVDELGRVYWERKGMDSPGELEVVKDTLKAGARA